MSLFRSGSAMFFFLRFVALAVAIQAAGAAQAEIVIKFSHVVAENAPKGEAAQLFRDRVHERLAGKVRVEIYPNSVLYNDTAVVKALLLGDVQMAAPAIAKLGRYSSKYAVFDLPFLFGDTDAVRCFFGSPTGKDLLDAMADSGLKGLSYWLHGMKQLSAGNEIRVPKDIAGKTFRIMESDVLERQFAALNAVPKRMPLNQVYGSLRAGVVDGHENTWANIYTQRLHETREFITETNHGALEYMVITSSVFWESLPVDIRAELEQILNEVSEEVTDIAIEKAAYYRARIVESGKVSIIILNDEELARWRNRMSPLWDEVKDEIGSGVIEAARACNR